MLLATGLVVGDRYAAQAAERLVEDAVRQSAPGATVDASIDTPFLPQFVRGRYDEVDVDLSGALQGVTVQSATVRLTGAEVAPSDALSGTVTRVPVQSADVRAVIGYAELSRLAGVGVASGGDGRVRVTRRFEVLGRELEASAVASVEVVDGDLVVRPERFQTGADVADALLQRVAGDRTLTVDPGQLPFGLVPTGVSPGPDGVALTARTGPAVLDAGSLPPR